MGTLIVKDNALIEASHKLGEIEQRLILLAILKARSQSDTIEQLQGKELIIHADDYINHFGATRQGAYKALKQAVMGLYRAEWGYKFINSKGNVEVVYERFTQTAKYIESEGTVKFMFANNIIPLLIELERNFTTYEIRQISNLSSGYAMRLYEFFMQHLDKKTGKGWLDISLKDLRFRFGLLPIEYTLMSDFKKRVLDFSIKQINKETDLTATYTQKKQGRTIVGFKFEFKRQPEATTAEQSLKPKKTVDIFAGLTELEQGAIKKRINEHIQRLESQGETVGDWHRDNITQKAVSERWGLDVLEKEQAKIRAEQERRAQELAQQRAEQEREAREQQQSEQRRQRVAELFESLPPEQQEFVLDEVAKKTTGIFIGIFKQSRTENKAHKHPMFIRYFEELLGVEKT
ncbi:replication initiation protein RepM [Conchiformibius steedae]|nr:replication initiation protein RepM [Conchiformibius steedae]